MAAATEPARAVGIEVFVIHVLDCATAFGAATHNASIAPTAAANGVTARRVTILRLARCALRSKHAHTLCERLAAILVFMGHLCGACHRAGWYMSRGGEEGSVL